jgi:hypothetical protein
VVIMPTEIYLDGPKAGFDGIKPNEQILLSLYAGVDLVHEAVVATTVDSLCQLSSPVLMRKGTADRGIDRPRTMAILAHRPKRFFDDVRYLHAEFFWNPVINPDVAGGLRRLLA